jgi:hypothetical protein
LSCFFVAALTRISRDALTAGAPVALFDDVRNRPYFKIEAVFCKSAPVLPTIFDAEKVSALCVTLLRQIEDRNNRAKLTK